MDTIATEQWTWMMCWSVSHLRIGITPPPGQDRGAIDDEVTCANQAAMESQANDDDE